MARLPKASRNKRTWKRMMNTKPRIECEREHDFALVLSGITELTPEVQDALFEAGCDDATISVRAGRVYLTFSRNSRSLKDAILTAIQDVKSARIGADVLGVALINAILEMRYHRKLDPELGEEILRSLADEPSSANASDVAPG